MMYFVLILSGVSLGLSLDFRELWFLGLISLVPLFYLLDIKIFSKRKAFFLSWLFGFSFAGMVIFWFWQTLPLDFLGVSNTLLGAGLVFIYWSTVTLVLSIFIGFFGLACFLIRNKFTIGIRIIIYAFLWVFFEYARLYGFAALTLGAQSTLEPYFSVGFIGYILAEHPFLLQLASFGKVYFLSFVVVLLNGIFYYLYLLKLSRSKKQLIAAVIFIVLVTPSVFQVGSFKLIKSILHKSESSNQYSIALLTTYFYPHIPQDGAEKETEFDEYNSLMKEISNSGKEPDIIVFPEDFGFLSALYDKHELETYFKPLLKDKETLVIDSSVVNESGKPYATIFYYDTKTGTYTESRKKFLTPQGEYTPYFYEAIINFIGQQKLVSFLKKYKNFAKGDSPVVGRFKNSTIGVAFCSEIMSERIYSDFVGAQGATVIGNVASNVWFHDSRIFYNQVLNMAKVRAVENNSYFFESANYSPSFILDNYGSVQSESISKKSSVLYGHIKG
jgi:apolipoprotein N-acyltransferase